jgi:glycosyltransferase involved in cell wall biosynthesis
VKDAVASVLCQTLPASQVVVVDDGSTDGTIEAIHAKFPSVELIAQRRAGQPTARNRGLAAARYDWVAYLDSDDLWHPKFLERAAAYLQENPDCEALRAPTWFFSDGSPGTEYSYGHRDFVAGTLNELVQQASEREHGNPYEYLKIKGESFTKLLDRSSGVMSTTIVRRSLAIIAGGFPIFARNGDDWMFFLNVARLAEWHLIEERLAFARIHPQQLGSDGATAVGNLGTKVAALYCGRPAPTQPDVFAPNALLEQNRLRYRKDVNRMFWKLLRQKEFKNARLVLQLGDLLLPRWQDRVFVYKPRIWLSVRRRLRPVATGDVSAKPSA